MKDCNADSMWAALFDLDGVVFDTESRYTEFWGAMGRKYHPEVPQLEQRIKGQTLVQIFDNWFNGEDEVQAAITAELNRFEHEMPYDYIPGVERFLSELKAAGVRTAVVTSSNEEKMRSVNRAHPEFRDYFDDILTSEFFSRSKPDPCCYLLGAQRFGLPVSRCVVFEDSFNGLKAGRAAEMKVVGLATTNSAEAIRPLSDWVVPDFTGLSVERVRALLDF